MVIKIVPTELAPKSALLRVGPFTIGVKVAPKSTRRKTRIKHSESIKKHSVSNIN